MARTKQLTHAVGGVSLYCKVAMPINSTRGTHLGYGEDDVIWSTPCSRPVLPFIEERRRNDPFSRLFCRHDSPYVIGGVKSDTIWKEPVQVSSLCRVTPHHPPRQSFPTMPPCPSYDLRASKTLPAFRIAPWDNQTLKPSHPPEQAPCQSLQPLPSDAPLL